MANNSPPNLQSIKTEAHALTATLADAPRLPRTYDPTVGEKAVLARRAMLQAIPAGQVQLPNCDCIQTAVAAMTLVERVRSARCAASFAQLPASIMEDASADALEELCNALVFLDTRARTNSATTITVRVDPALIAEGVALRDRMLRVVEYHFNDNPVMLDEIADIRRGIGYVDTASDLQRVATHYSIHAAKLAKDTVQYNPADEDRARHIASAILDALHASDDSALIDLRNRAWTKVMRIYAKLRAAGELIFIDSPIDLALFPALRQAVMAMNARSRSAGGEPPAPEPVAPAQPIVAPPIATSPVAPPIGAGPGGNPLSG